MLRVNQKYWNLFKELGHFRDEQESEFHFEKEN